MPKTGVDIRQIVGMQSTRVFKKVVGKKFQLNFAELILNIYRKTFIFASLYLRSSNYYKYIDSSDIHKYDYIFR